MPLFFRWRCPIALCVLMAAGSASADTGPSIQERKPTAAELSSFARFFHRAHPDSPTPPPLSAWRSLGERRWRVASAPFQLTPPRAAGPLCSSDAVQFTLDAQWRESPPYQQVWLGAPNCAAEHGRVRRAPALADPDVIRLLQRQQAVLARARLLMAGNSYCAKERSSRFFLAAILSQSGSKVTLEYRSDRPVVLTVGARLSGADYDVWDVHCAFGPAP
jgi:hypothetical protein